MQSYIKYKEYYDRKAKAAPLKENDYCFVLQPKTDHQGSKIPFSDYRWVGPFIVQKFLPNENYIIRRLNTNKTQILHRIRLRCLSTNPPSEDSFRHERLEKDEEITIPQDDLYTITWETNFGEQLAPRGNEPIPTSLPNGEPPSTAEANSNDVNENEADYLITTDSPNTDNDAPQCPNERMKATSAKQMKLLTRLEMKTLFGRIRPFTTKIKKKLSRICLIDRKTMQIFQKSPNKGDDFIVPEISQNDERNESLSHRGGNITSGLILTQTTQKTLDTRKC